MWCKLCYWGVILFCCELEFTNDVEAAYVSVYWSCETMGMSESCKPRTSIKAVNNEVVLRIKTEGALLWRESMPGSSPLLEVSFRMRCLFMG